MAPVPSLKAPESNAVLTVYYDGACPVCSREIALYRRQPGADACAWVDASSCDGIALGPDLDAPTALARMHVRRADGSLVGGARAFITLWQSMPRTRLLGRLAAIPPLPWLLEAGYRTFLAVRPLWRARSPSADSPVTPALRAELRSDHAGETGAVCIYRGILAVTRVEAVRAFALRHLGTEQSHLEQIETWLPPQQRSRLLPAWRLAGWLTGAIPALFGARAVFGTIESVETFVDRHYAQQLDLIDALPPDPTRAELRAVLLACQTDELAHRDEAAMLGGREPPSGLLKLWCAIVGSGSAAAVTLARRL